MQSQQNLYDELSCYTLAHPNPAFIHQNSVDAFAAQTADVNTKPITLTFALVGLYLYLEKNFTGKQVQLAHMRIAKHTLEFPRFILPENRGTITVFDVLKIPPRDQRDAMIRKWCVSVWEAYRVNQKQVNDFLNKYF